MRLKYLFSLLSLSFLLVAFTSPERQGPELCEGKVIDRMLCQKMITMRSMVFVLEAQRELMQVNPSLIESIGHSLNETAQSALQLLGPDIPEHRQGLVNVSRMAEDMAYRAAKRDGDMMMVANSIKTNCSTCHSGRNPAGEFGWDDIFESNWEDLNKHCQRDGKNPYLCKSMYAMVSAHSYNTASYEANIYNFQMTAEIFREISRILQSLRDNGFRHLPSKDTDTALNNANHIIQLAESRNPEVFGIAKDFDSTCMACHSSQMEDLSRAALEVKSW